MARFEFYLAQATAQQQARRENIKKRLFEQQLERELMEREDAEYEKEQYLAELARMLKKVNRLEVMVRKQAQAREDRIREDALEAIRNLNTNSVPYRFTRKN